MFYHPKYESFEVHPDPLWQRKVISIRNGYVGGYLTYEAAAAKVADVICAEKISMSDYLEFVKKVGAPSGQYVVDPSEHGYMGDSFVLNGLDDFRLQFTTSDAMTVTEYLEYIGTLIS